MDFEARTAIQKQTVKELPQKCPHCHAKLKFNGTDLLCDNINCIGAQLPLMVNFFKKLKVDAMGEGTVANFAKAGYNSVSKILAMSPKTMAKLDGMGEKSAQKIIAGIKKTISKWQLTEFMAASGVFSSDRTSLGNTLLEEICGKYTINELRNLKIKAYELTTLPKIGTERAELFIESLPLFLQFYEDIKRVSNISFAKTSGDGPLSGQTFVFTNFRDDALEATIKSNGGKIGSSVTFATTAVFSGGGGSGKLTRAAELKQKGVNIQIVPAAKAKAWIENELVPF